MPMMMPIGLSIGCNVREFALLWFFREPRKEAASQASTIVEEMLEGDCASQRTVVEEKIALSPAC